MFRLRVYTVKNAKKSKKCFLSYDLPDSADRSVSRRRYYRNSREIMGLQEKIKYSMLVEKTQKSVEHLKFTICSAIFLLTPIRLAPFKGLLTMFGRGDELGERMLLQCLSTEGAILHLF